MTSRTLNPEKIVRTAMQLINEQIPLSFTNISKQLGTRSQALYNYFTDVKSLNVAIAKLYSTDLFNFLQSALIGISGKAAVIRYAISVRNYSLEHFRIAQFVISTPREQLQANQADASDWSIRNLLNQLLDTMSLTPTQHLNASRMIRNLVIGEILNVGSGWFKNETVAETASFERMLTVGLKHLDEL
ncbi:TetR/AcrR family transcriptional regulator [Secundilactobacillus folii]|uniref:TetR family transcriptional regulator n=1 Tax=Secundilactobacillus folii TaxID=2678357 RepID=A0A7X2XUG2_9LACO|nr:TetR/AcrR family transcriptional regulator [Secundilactobacillus folii]MTV81844.1 hypothetical protein [Secundilactobacillus folii]